MPCLKGAENELMWLITSSKDNMTTFTEKKLCQKIMEVKFENLFAIKENVFPCKQTQTKGKMIQQQKQL